MIKTKNTKTLVALCCMSLVALAHISCDGNGGDSMDCISFIEANLGESECIAESYLELCEGLSCNTDPGANIGFLFQSCTAIDCTTLE